MARNHCKSFWIAGVRLILPRRGARLAVSWTRWKKGFAARRQEDTWHKLPRRHSSLMRETVGDCAMRTTRSNAFVSLLDGMETVRCAVLNTRPSTSTSVFHVVNFSSLMARGPRTAIIAKRSASSAPCSRNGVSTSTRT
jgi:hypothetical protein